MNDAHPSRAPRASKPLLILGIGLILLGVLFSLDSLGLADVGTVVKLLLPSILIFMGYTKYREERGTAGYGLMLAGIFLALVFFARGRFEDLIPALMMVALGIFVLLKGLHQQRARVRMSEPVMVPAVPEDGEAVPPTPSAAPSPDAYLSGTAILTGYKRRILNQDLRGGELTAIFGGFELDLRRSALQNNQATLDVFVLFGGGKVMVPQDWQVDIRTTAIAGAVEDKTMAMGEAPSQDRPRLVLTGTALFGGVEITH